MQCFFLFKCNDINFSRNILSNVMTSPYFQLTSMDDLEQDLVLMFDNACRYNEPDSQVYKVRFVGTCYSVRIIHGYLCNISVSKVNLESLPSQFSQCLVLISVR